MTIEEELVYLRQENKALREQLAQRDERIQQQQALLAEQNTFMALKFAKHGYILENGRVVMDGDAKSLMGGTLLQTPLRAADGSVYAVAQGQLSVGGFSASGVRVRPRCSWRRSRVFSGPSSMIMNSKIEKALKDKRVREIE